MLPITCGVKRFSVFLWAHLPSHSESLQTVLYLTRAHGLASWSSAVLLISQGNLGTGDG